MRFHGSPMTWMRQFMPNGKAVKRINPRPPREPAQWVARGSVAKRINRLDSEV